jgi:chorismate synthase
VSTATQEPTIVIRDVERVAEMREVETLQKVVWGCEDLDVVPATMLIASREVGAVLVGAYDGPSLVGFVYGFPAYENRELVHHSHMLAVLPAYRNFHLGYKLKLAQRDRVQAQGIKRITWTFDPLQSLNAYFNFRKLGVVADAYKINFYGETTSSFLHQIGTDRLWVTWLVDSQWVNERLQSDDLPKHSQVELDQIPALVRVSNSEPLGYESKGFGEPLIAIEVPGDINALQHQQSNLALRWREATRWAFTMALASGYLVEDCYRSTRDEESLGVYLLRHHAKMADFE